MICVNIAIQDNKNKCYVNPSPPAIDCLRRLACLGLIQSLKFKKQSCYDPCQVKRNRSPNSKNVLFCYNCQIIKEVIHCVGLLLKYSIGCHECNYSTNHRLLTLHVIIQMREVKTTHQQGSL